MQELYLLIKQRFEKLNALTHSTPSNDSYRELRQQQKLRCQKQAWILSMFRAKKTNMNTSAKNSFFKYSYEIMKVIDPTFTYEAEPNLSDQNFLNDFVCLYTKFFDNYEDKFQFKVKVKNLLRPTNHNILNDMVKYLADFSRDYSQHIYIWQMKSMKKQEEQNQQNQRRNSINSSHIQSVIYSSANSQINYGINQAQQKQMQSFRNSMNIGNQTSIRRYGQQNQTQIAVKKSQYNKIYGVLEIQPPPNTLFFDKNKTNVDVLRLRMNQLYRDAKYRNNFIKNQINLYHNTYQAKYNPTLNNLNSNKQSYIQDNCPHISHPYRVSLVIERNGFSCINISTYEKGSSRDQRNLSPIKDKLRLSSLSNKQQGLSSLGSTKSSKNDFVLNSLKVLRVSENFLPPLHARKQSTRVNSQQQSKKQSQPISNKLSSCSNTQNLMNLQLQSAKQDQVNNNGVIYYNQQLLRQAERRKNQKRRLNQMRKHFTSQQRKSKNNKKNDPQQKIVEWLDKINIMKQLERKKILGLG